METDEHCFKDFLRDLHPFPLGFCPIDAAGSPKDAFDPLIVKNIGVVSLINVVTVEVINIHFSVSVDVSSAVVAMN